MAARNPLPLRWFVAALNAHTNLESARITALNLTRPKKLKRRFFQKATPLVAESLLGCFLCRRFNDGSTQRLRIVETEAYLGETDPAAHSFCGKTERNKTMWGEKGYSYVYLIYGMYHCINVTSGPANLAEAVLIRACEPSNNVHSKKHFSGPGKICRELKIDRKFDGVDFCGDQVWFERGRLKKGEIVKTSPRIGINQKGLSAKWPLRFYIDNHTSVSKHPKIEL